MRGLHTLLLVASSLIAASAQAHVLLDPAQPAATGWALAWARHQDADPLAPVHGAAACALGDVDADGVDDILLRAKGEAGARLEALKGPDHKEVLWTTGIEAAATLRCAPDALADGVADPIVVLREAAGSSVPEIPEAPAGSASATATLRTVDGLSGSPLFEIRAEESASGAAAGFAAGGRSSSVDLESGGADLFLLVEREATGLDLLLPVQDLLLSGGRAEVRIEILDAAGDVQGTIEAAQPQAQILAHAAVAEAEEARILVLSASDAVPADQAAAQVATVAAHAKDGSLLWSVELDATTDLLLMLPYAGDVDGDGTVDLIVESMSSGVEASAGSALTVLSGADGSQLLSRAIEGEGLLAALPLGDVSTGEAAASAEALLVVTQDAPDAPIALECVLAGETCWTAELPAEAIPVNTDIDRFTGDLRGFLDVTGDGVADVAAAIVADAGARIDVLSGVDGALAWSAPIDAGASVHAVASGTGADLAIVSAARADGRELALWLVDGATGKLHWALESAIAPEIKEPHVDVEVVAGAHGDAATLLVTVSGASAAAGADADVAGALEHVYAIDAATGETTWAGATLDGAAAPPELLSIASAADGGSVADVPGASVALTLAVIAAVAFTSAHARRRSRP